MNCSVCGNTLYFRFSKPSGDGTPYQIHECRVCGIWQVVPIPSREELDALYQGSYFTERTDRGYHNYASEQVRRSVESTFRKNLTDLGFDSWEKSLPERRALEVGCAAGYFVGHLLSRGWDATGLEVSEPMVKAAQEMGYPVSRGDYLQTQFNKKFHLIALWATLEHLPDPFLFAEKMSKDLESGGIVILSTCNTGFWAKKYGLQWRFLNVPEHIWYFNRKNLRRIFEKYGLNLVKSFTYGSGFTSKPDASRFYRLKKFCADRLAKYFHSGDMIVCQFKKK